MKQYFKHIAVTLLCLFVGTNTTFAQENSVDSLKVKKNFEEQEEAIDSTIFDEGGFDARLYLNQKRYVPENEAFIRKKRWHDHMYVDLAGGVQWFDNTAGSRRLKNGFLGMAYLGLDLTSVHGVRLGLGMNRFTDGTALAISDKCGTSLLV